MNCKVCIDEQFVKRLIMDVITTWSPPVFDKGKGTNQKDLIHGVETMTINTCGRLSLKGAWSNCFNFFFKLSEILVSEEFFIITGEFYG